MSQPSCRVEFYLEGAWVDVSSDVLMDEEVEVERGMAADTPFDRVAQPGRARFTMENSWNSSGGVHGYYEAGHPNARAGFQHNVRCRVIAAVDDPDALPLFGEDTFGSVLFGGGGAGLSPGERYIFHGWIRKIDATAGQFSRSHITAADYMQFFQDIGNLSLTLSTSKRFDEGLGEVVSKMPVAPLATSYDTGVDTWPFLWDDLGGRVAAMTAAFRLAYSEGGYIYVRGDHTGGELLRAENRTNRQTVSSALTLTDADLIDIESPSNLERVFNDIEVRVWPRRADDTPVVLVLLEKEIEVGAGETVTIWTDYRDPEQKAEYVGGRNMVSPIATTDFTANDTSGGGGTDVTADFTVTATFFGSRCKLEIENTGASTGYLRGPSDSEGMQVRGEGLYRFSPISVFATNDTSIGEFNNRELPRPFDMHYLDVPETGRSWASLIAANFSGLGNVPLRVVVRSEDPAVLARTLPKDIGDRVTIQSASRQVDTDVFIHGTRLVYSQFSWSTEWTTAPADPTAGWVWGSDTAKFDEGAFAYG